MDQYTILSFNEGPGRQPAWAVPIDGVPEGQVYARVRFWVNDQEIDENIKVPDLLPGQADNREARAMLVTPLIEARLKELEAGELQVTDIHDANVELNILPPAPPDPKQPVIEHNLEQNISPAPEARDV